MADDKTDKALETFVTLVKWEVNDKEEIDNITYEQIEVPLDISYCLVDTLELFGDVDVIERDVYARYLGEDHVVEGYTVAKHNAVYDLICIQNKRAIVETDAGLFGWINPEDFEIIEPSVQWPEDIDFEDITKH